MTDKKSAKPINPKVLPNTAKNEPLDEKAIHKLLRVPAKEVQKEFERKRKERPKK